MMLAILATVLVACTGSVEDPLGTVGDTATVTDTDTNTDSDTDTDTDSDTAFFPDTDSPWACEVYTKNGTVSFSGETIRDQQTTEYCWLIAGTIPVVITNDSGDVRSPDYAASFDAEWSGRFLSGSEMELSEGNWNDMWGEFTSQCWLEE